jgi:hypothetical protein
VSRALDPHLHSHVVVANVARGTDGRWSAIDSRSVVAHAAAAGALYDCHLRAELVRRLGLEWEAGPMGATPEVRGVDAPVRAVFSSRSADIRRQVWDWQAGSGRARRLAWAATRDPKSGVLDPDQLARSWVDRAASAGLEPAAIDRLTRRPLAPAPAVRTGATLDEHRVAAALWVSPHASPTRRDVVAAWAGALTQGAPVHEVVGAVDAWADAGGAIGVDEPRLALRTVLPGRATLQALGPRPVAAAAQPIYRAGAAAIDGYRARWRVTDPAHPLGVDGTPASLAALGARRLADHLEVERTVQGVARALGREVVLRHREQGLDRGRSLAD